MARFLAIDASISCTGLSILEYVGDNKFNLISKNSISLGKKTFENRFTKKYEMYKLFKFYIDSNVDDISFAVFENYSYGSTGHLADLGELNGMYKLVLEENGIPFDTVAPSSAKKAITGNGRATKEEVAGALKNFIINIDSFVFADNDQTDSIAVGVTYALIMLNHLKKNNE